jgi:hypothetical protein
MEVFDVKGSLNKDLTSGAKLPSLALFLFVLSLANNQFLEIYCLRI